MARLSLIRVADILDRYPPKQRAAVWDELCGVCEATEKYGRKLAAIDWCKARRAGSGRHRKTREQIAAEAQPIFKIAVDRLIWLWDGNDSTLKRMRQFRARYPTLKIVGYVANKNPLDVPPSNQAPLESRHAPSRNRRTP